MIVETESGLLTLRRIFMRLTNSKEIMEFRYAIAKYKGDVWLEDQEGNKFNLKSVISQYIALGELLQDKGENLELFCSIPEDESHFHKPQMLSYNPSILASCKDDGVLPTIGSDIVIITMPTIIPLNLYLNLPVRYAVIHGTRVEKKAQPTA